MSKDDAILKALQEKRKAEFKKERDVLKKAQVVNKNKGGIEASLRDKAVLPQNEFTQKGTKAAGMSAGYVATDINGNTVILKQFYKDPKKCKTQQDHTNRRDGVKLNKIIPIAVMV